MEPGCTVCVTGAAGYVGGWLVRRLLEEGCTVRACVRRINDERKVGFLKSMPEHGRRLRLHSADMTVSGAYDTIFEGCTVVFHAAEVFMSFGPGRDAKAAKSELGRPREKGLVASIHKAAMDACANVAASIDKSCSVRRLIYTSSIAAMMGTGSEFYANPCIDESREPYGTRPESYNATKRLTEKFFDYAAAASCGRWSVLMCNPSDIIGPILSAHHANETWQGKIAGVLQGIPAPYELGRPWFVVDVRDVAEAQVLLAKAGRDAVRSGSRFLCCSGDKLPPQDIGLHVMAGHPGWDCPDTLQNDRNPKEPAPRLLDPMWMRVQPRTDALTKAIGMRFRAFSETFNSTVASLVEIGGVRPRT
eukprot:TRINITY_DN61073_c0_g1_i1.p1 TRINITY_DN61073_c0_g1~~TRINITY_DN61073_c0_g1_i1.p1  ORF type:complete len:362 (-),score=41.89 TRINITY_DN61073_c0_g1_i1:70-1155(-)